MHNETESEEVNAAKIGKGEMDKTADYDDTQPMSFWSFIRYIKEKMTAR